ncbi:MAG: NAD-dependent epimerase/dehydratase family protein [Myxococcales bacterium]|nr:NAD-dependent epimerase/dehydratase family protein [Myxococcales bacterium]
MRILVTGAAGFIGSAICQALLERGDTVCGLDNFDPYYDRALKERNVARLAVHEAFSLIEGDLLDDEAVARSLAGADAVMHLAALAGVRPSIAAPARYMRVNVEGTMSLLERCREAGVDRVVVASSSSVYGSRSQVPFREDDACDRPASPYAASKKATELCCAAHNELHGTAVTCLRYFTVYGPGQRPEMAIHKFVRLAERGEQIPMFGDGSSGRDYTFIDDIVAGSIAALDRQQAGRFAIYNLGGDHAVLLRDLIAAIGVATGRELDIEQLPLQPGDVPITSADISRARDELGYAPSTTLEQGLARFVAWYRQT